MSEAPSSRPALPGDLTPAERLARILRVDHAGEYGAVRIYEGQLAVLGDGPEAAPLCAMMAKEREHLETLDRLVADRGIRPTALMPLWHLAGYALGGITALLGPKAAMACTVAIEDVIDEHYARQRNSLEEIADEGALKTLIEDFRRDEAAHRDEALRLGAEGAPLYGPLTAAIRTASRLAIWLSERV